MGVSPLHRVCLLMGLAAVKGARGKPLLRGKSQGREPTPGVLLGKEHLEPHRDSSSGGGGNEVSAEAAVLPSDSVQNTQVPGWGP